MNKKIYTPNLDYLNLEEVISYLHKLGFTVRLTCTLIKGFIDTPEKVLKLINFAKRNKVEHLTLGFLSLPEINNDNKISLWIKRHMITTDEKLGIYNALKMHGRVLLEYSFGTLFDVNGQNVFLRDCLSIGRNDKIRSLIFFPSGHLYFSWQYNGAIIF